MAKWLGTLSISVLSGLMLAPTSANAQEIGGPTAAAAALPSGECDEYCLPYRDADGEIYGWGCMQTTAGNGDGDGCGGTVHGCGYAEQCPIVVEGRVYFNDEGEMVRSCQRPVETNLALS